MPVQTLYTVLKAASFGYRPRNGVGSDGIWLNQIAALTVVALRASETTFRSNKPEGCFQVATSRMVTSPLEIPRANRTSQHCRTDYNHRALCVSVGNGMVGSFDQQLAGACARCVKCSVSGPDFPDPA